MGRVRTKTVKKASRLIIEKYYTRLTSDFQTNKKICEEIAMIPSKRLRNKIAGFTTHLMARIQKAPVRGISIKLQEEERERRDNYVPDVSALEHEGVLEVDADTRDLLRHLQFGHIPVSVPAVIADTHQPRDARPQRDGRERREFQRRDRPDRAHAGAAAAPAAVAATAGQQ